MPLKKVAVTAFTAFTLLGGGVVLAVDASAQSVNTFDELKLSGTTDCITDLPDAGVPPLLPCTTIVQPVPGLQILEQRTAMPQRWRRVPQAGAFQVKGNSGRCLEADEVTGHVTLTTCRAGRIQQLWHEVPSPDGATFRLRPDFQWHHEPHWVYLGAEPDGRLTTADRATLWTNH